MNAGTRVDSPTDVSLLQGQLVDGKYRVERLIGVGGMAAVWAGTNERTGKRVALKVLLRSVASTPAARELFYSEGLVASRVNHPNVVTIFDVIEHEGMTCMVMELLDGEPLSRLLDRKGTLGVQEATWLLIPAMRGVAAANAQGVIHRDLKPQNIFLCVEPNGRIVTTKVLDFGISVLVDRVLDLSRGLFVGTPNYMSPEHVGGLAIIDGRADVYGFGVLFYETFTGRMAFPGQPGEELFNSIINHAPLSLASLRPDLSSGMVAIVEQAIAKQPDERFPNLTTMISALEVELLALGLGPAVPSVLPGSLAPTARELQSESMERTPAARDTMVLYGLAREDGAAAQGSAGLVASSANASDTMVVTPKDRASARLPVMRWVGWKAGLATAVGIAIGVLVWKVTRPVAPAEVLHLGPGSVTVQTVPTVIPLATPEPEPQQTRAPPEPERIESTSLETAVPVVIPKKSSRARSTMIASAREGSTAPQSLAGKTRAPAEREGAADSASRANAVSKLPMRAGSLSPADF